MSEQVTSNQKLIDRLRDWPLGEIGREAADTIEHLQRRLDMREELVDGFEKQLGIQQADATITIGSEIERLQRACKKLENQLGNAQRRIFNLDFALRRISEECHASAREIAAQALGNSRPADEPPAAHPPFTVDRYGSLAAAITAERDWLLWRFQQQTKTRCANSLDPEEEQAIGALEDYMQTSGAAGSWSRYVWDVLQRLLRAPPPPDACNCHPTHMPYCATRQPPTKDGPKPATWMPPCPVCQKPECRLTYEECSVIHRQQPAETSGSQS